MSDIDELRKIFQGDQQAADMEVTAYVEKVVSDVNKVAYKVAGTWALKIEGDSVVMHPELYKLLKANPELVDRLFPNLFKE